MAQYFVSLVFNECRHPPPPFLFSEKKLKSIFRHYALVSLQLIPHLLWLQDEKRRQRRLYMNTNAHLCKRPVTVGDFTSWGHSDQNTDITEMEKDLCALWTTKERPVNNHLLFAFLEGIQTKRNTFQYDETWSWIILLCVKSVWKNQTLTDNITSEEIHTKVKTGHWPQKTKYKRNQFKIYLYLFFSGTFLLIFSRMGSFLKKFKLSLENWLLNENS